MIQHGSINTHQKALAINLDASRYGTFAEIGAGQEVVRWFFQVGGAAGTVAKSMSAYDMQVSDAVYGKSERYVSFERLIQMLDHEYSLNVERLSHTPKKLFAFADTVVAKAFRGNNECHGWLGLRFQHEPGASASQIVVHVRMLDHENLQQQQALGIFGVNLIYGAFYSAGNTEQLLSSLLDELSSDRIQVDMVEIKGPAFQPEDPRLHALRLVKLGLSDVAMFASDGRVLQPSDVLYKRPILLLRGSFRPVTNTHLDLFQAAQKAFTDSLSSSSKAPLCLMEITMKNLLETSEADSADFLARSETLSTIGQPVIVTNFSEYYRVVSYLRRLCQEPIAIALGLNGLREILDQKYYAELEGGIFEGLAKLFRSGVLLYVMPLKEQSGQVTTVENLEVPFEISHLVQHCRSHGQLLTLTGAKAADSSLTSQDILKLIQSGDPEWVKHVPGAVAEVISNRGYFGVGNSMPRGNIG